MALRIERLISGAYGLSHDEQGRTVLVKSALEGELVEPEKIERRANVLVAEDYDILEKSPLRISPACPYYGECGGCDFLSVSERESAHLKEEIVRENLVRIAKTEHLPEFLPPSFASFASYRSRCRFHVDMKRKEIGFLRRGSNTLFPLDHCPSLTGRINALLSEKESVLKEAQRKRILEGVNRKTGYVEIPIQDGDEEVSFTDRTITALGYHVNPYCFFQSNLTLLPSMLSFVKENTVGNVVMDLYSGVGTFSRLFEGDVKKVYAVEKNPRCLSLSKKNAPHALSFTSDALLFSKKVRESVDTVIVDPPRVGLDRQIIPVITSWNAERIIYVSCDSVSASRDISLFKGYELRMAKIFDFYPGSFHEESVFILEKI